MSEFVVAWCSEGLECVVPVTDIERQVVFDLISGKQPEHTVSHVLNMLILRAKFNPQRFYEIYAITGEEGITEDDITEMFNNSPQTAADTIREKGTQIYSDRVKPSRIKIT